MQLQLNISGSQYSILQKHLYPGDNKEAVAVALCGRLSMANFHRLLVREVITIPYNECLRGTDVVEWTTDRIVPLIERAGKENLAILKIHSHPGGYDRFSSLDDESDRRLFESIFGWTETDDPHGSAIMLPDGSMIARFFFSDLSAQRVNSILVAGDSILKWSNETITIDMAVGLRLAQAFGEKTYGLLKQLKIGIVGCSGTGSIVTEQLARLGTGHLVIVDPDRIEAKNLNRILNSTREDAQAKRLKTDIIKNAIEAIQLGTIVTSYSTNIYEDRSSLIELASCDILIGCVDSIDGRDLLNRLSTYYVLPYFDLGVKLEADGAGGVSKIVASVNYIQPGKSSLLSRGLYDQEDLKAAGLLRTKPDEFPDLVKNSYIKNIRVDRPAVISVNMMIASHAINELLNRIHPYKAEKSEEYAQTTIDLTENCIINVSEVMLPLDNFLKNKVGFGDRRIFLDSVELQ